MRSRDLWFSSLGGLNGEPRRWRRGRAAVSKGWGGRTVGEVRAAGIRGEMTAPGAAKERREILRSISPSREAVHAEEEGGLSPREWRICQYSGRRIGEFLCRVGGAGGERESRRASHWLWIREESRSGK